MPHTNTTQPVVIARTLICLAIASALFGLPGCTSCGGGDSRETS